jgi:subtilisin family serine protease
MKLYKVFSLFMVFCFMLSMTLSAKPVNAQVEPPADPGEFIPGEVVVMFKPGMKVNEYAASAADLAGRTQTTAVKVSKEGMALLRGDASVNISQLIETIEANSNVLFAEPNYVYRIPSPEVPPEQDTLEHEFVFRTSVSSETGEEETMVIPVSYLQNLKSELGGNITATYPNDPYLWSNWGWDYVDADVVSPNTTASAGVCVLDSGVDYLHPDLSGNIIKGYDFVNADTDPMDDNGHGTHVAGIIAAKPNNKIGIAGASNAKVVAVKVLGAQGWGTNFDITAGINFCANRSDVKVLNISLGSTVYSLAIDNAVAYAVNTKGKLVVAAAGNDNTATISYPAGLSLTYPGKVLSVAASGTSSNRGCRASYSNYGNWVNIIAPGTGIFSTLPYDKPFYKNYYGGTPSRYGEMSGTSMAAPFVAAAAARRWGYKPKSTNVEVFNAVVNSGWAVSGDGSCWPAVMNGRHIVNIANLLDRYAVEAYILDASTGVGLDGAALQVYKGKTLLGSAVITPLESINRDWTTVINLPAPTDGTPFWWNNEHTYKVSKSGYTSSPQEALQHNNSRRVYPATFVFPVPAALPPKSTNLEVVTGWNVNTQYQYQNALNDLDLYVWLPGVPNPLDGNQPAPFIVGWLGNSYGYLESDPKGSMNYFPFARYKREGGVKDLAPVENITISSRKAHAPLAANPALPYYPGDYVIGVTDNGSTFDHDGKSTTPKIPVMGAAYVPYLYIWKDGVIKLFNRMPNQVAGGACNTRWWRGATISSGKTGAITYTPQNSCNSNQKVIFPY